MKIKCCLQEEIEGLDNIQRKYHDFYGHDKEELKYRDFKVKTLSAFNDPVTVKVYACCREHARDIVRNNVISVFDEACETDIY